MPSRVPKLVAAVVGYLAAAGATLGVGSLFLPDDLRGIGLSLGLVLVSVLAIGPLGAWAAMGWATRNASQEEL